MPNSGPYFAKPQLSSWAFWEEQKKPTPGAGQLPREPAVDFGSSKSAVDLWVKSKWGPGQPFWG